MPKVKLIKNELLKKIKNFKSKYQKIALSNNDEFSNIDTAYFPNSYKNFKDNFSKVLKVQRLKKS